MYSALIGSAIRYVKAFNGMCQIKSLDLRQDLRLVGNIFFFKSRRKSRDKGKAQYREISSSVQCHIVNGLRPISAKATRENSEAVSLASDHDDGTDVYDARDKETRGPLACQPSVSLAV